jgi:hypothetical protein
MLFIKLNLLFFYKFAQITKIDNFISQLNSNSNNITNNIIMTDFGKENFTNY